MALQKDGQINCKTTAVSVAKPRLIRPSAALAVITGGGYGYQRPDGVGVIPVGALGP